MLSTRTSCESCIFLASLSLIYFASIAHNNEDDVCRIYRPARTTSTYILDESRSIYNVRIHTPCWHCSRSTAKQCNVGLDAGDQNTATISGSLR